MAENTAALPLVMTDELAKAIKDTLDPASLKQLILAEAERQATAAQDAATTQAAADAAKAAADAAKAAETPADFSRTETIGGREFAFTATSELELERMITQAYKVAYGVQPTQTVPDVVEVSDADKAAIAAAQAAEKAELELKFKRGDISASEYIEQSGAIKEYLEKVGIPLDELRNTVEQGRNKAFEQSWEQATEEFLHSAAGADWPGGEKNTELIGLKMAALGLVNADDKVAAMAQAYQALKAEGMLFAVETSTDDSATQLAAAQKIVDDARAAATAAATATTTAAAPAAAATPAPTTPTSSSLFGASSGVGAGVGTTERAVSAQIQIPKDASPEEILQIWKSATVAAGKSPDDAFRDHFNQKR